MNNITTNSNNATSAPNTKDLMQLTDTAADLQENIKRVILMLSEVTNAIDKKEPVPPMFLEQAATMAHIALDYACKASDNAQQLFDELYTMYKAERAKHNDTPTEPVKGATE